MSISDKALLVNLSIRQWIGKRIDKRATETVEATHLTEKKSGNFTKKLLPGAKELEDIQRLSGALRVFFYEQTLPWCSDGSRIISSKNYIDFTTDFRNKKSEFDRAVAEFLYSYPTLKEQAKIKLGDLYKEHEYPDMTELELAFSCDVTFMPVPDVKDFRVELSEQEKQTFLDSMAKVESQALRDCWNRMHEVVTKAVVKLSEPEAVFRDSLISNIQEICTLMPKLNVTDDPNLETMSKDIQIVVSKLNPEMCRDNSHARNQAAEKLDNILDKMSVFMG